MAELVKIPKSAPCRHCGAAPFDLVSKYGLAERCGTCDGPIDWIQVPTAHGGLYVRGFCTNCPIVYELTGA